MQLEVRRGPQDEVRSARRCSSSFKISVRAVSQGIVWTRPSAISRERRSSSDAHALATSSVGSSKLDNNSSTTRARSERGSRRTSARISSAVDIGLSLSPDESNPLESGQVLFAPANASPITRAEGE
jgi:hypothetical protein